MSETSIRLYYLSQPLGPQIDRALLQQLRVDHPQALLSLEPAIGLPMHEGQPRAGRHPQLNLLSHTLPPEGITIQEAAFYDTRSWIMLAAPQPASGWTGRQLTWSLDPIPQATAVEGIRCKPSAALAWRDRKRFDLEEADAESYSIERFYRGSELITWRILPSAT